MRLILFFFWLAMPFLMLSCKKKNKPSNIEKPSTERSLDAELQISEAQTVSIKAVAFNFNTPSPNEKPSIATYTGDILQESVPDSMHFTEILLQEGYQTSILQIAHRESLQTFALEQFRLVGNYETLEVLGKGCYSFLYSKAMQTFFLSKENVHIENFYNANQFILSVPFAGEICIDDNQQIIELNNKNAICLAGDCRQNMDHFFVDLGLKVEATQSDEDMLTLTIIHKYADAFKKVTGKNPPKAGDSNIQKSLPESTLVTPSPARLGNAGDASTASSKNFYNLAQQFEFRGAQYVKDTREFLNAMGRKGEYNVGGQKFTYVETLGEGGSAGVIKVKANPKIEGEEFFAVKILDKRDLFDGSEQSRFAESTVPYRIKEKLGQEADKYIIESRFSVTTEDTMAIEFQRLGTRSMASEMADQFLKFKTLDPKGRRSLAEQQKKDFLQIATILDAFASKGIALRDLKPGNIVRDTDGRLKLIDLNNADIGDPRVRIGMTRSYADPTVLSKLAKPTRATDDYAFGIMLLQSRTGKSIGDLWDEYKIKYDRDSSNFVPEESANGNFHRWLKEAYFPDSATPSNIDRFTLGLLEPNAKKRL